MSSSTTNSSFLGKINSLAGNMSDLNVSDARVGKMSAGNLSVSDLNVSKGGFRRSTLVAFAADNFATASGESVTLMTSADQSAPSSSGASGVATLPEGAVVTAVIADNYGTTIVGGTTIALTVGAFNGSADQTMASGAAPSVYNTAGGLYASDVTTNVEASGAAPAVVVAASPNNFVNATVQGTNTAGDLRVVVEYYTLS